MLCRIGAILSRGPSVSVERAIPGLFLLLVSSFSIARGQSDAQAAKPKTAGEAFKNVQVLKDLPEGQFWATMSFFADSLGVNCERCHADPYDQDRKPEKIKARQMIRMVRDMNERYFASEQKVTCNTCHRGTTLPVRQPALDAQHWIDFSKLEAPLPSGAGLIARYRKLTGVAAAAASRAERVSYDMTIYLSEAPPRKEVTELTIGGPDRFRMIRNSDGRRREWIRNGDVAWAATGDGWKAADGNEMNDISGEAASFDWETLKDVSGPKAIQREMARGRQAVVVEARDHGERVWLYFDERTGLLLRKRSFSPSFFADECWDVEYDDYRKVGAVTLPFLVQILNPSGNGLTVRKVTERMLIAHLDEALFNKPAMAN